MYNTSKLSNLFLGSLFRVFIVRVEHFATCKQIDFMAKTSTHQMCSFALSFWVSNLFAVLSKHLTTGKSYLEETWSPYSGLATSASLHCWSFFFASCLDVVSKYANSRSSLNCQMYLMKTWKRISMVVHNCKEPLHADEMCWLFGIRNHLGRKAFEGWIWWGLASYSMLCPHPMWYSYDSGDPRIATVVSTRRGNW